MFTKEFYNGNLTLTSRLAIETFPNIKGHCFKGETSFLATLRALLPQRGVEAICVEYRNLGYSENNINSLIDEEFIYDITRYDIDNKICIDSISNSSTAGLTGIKRIEAGFLKHCNGYEDLKDLGVFISKQGVPVKFFINRTSKRVHIITATMNIRLWHLIQSLVSRFLPWYFESNPLDEKEKALVRSLTEKTSDNYEALIEEFASKYDFRTQKIKSFMKDFSKKLYETRLFEVKGVINNKEYEIAQNLARYSQLLKEIEDARIRLCGLETLMDKDTGDNELVDYLISNKHINPISMTDGRLEIIADTVINNYDPDLYERMAKNNDSYLFRGYSPTAPQFADKNIRKEFLDAIFSDEILRIKVCAYYKLYISGDVSTTQRYPYPAEYKDFLMNPHFEFHACIGNNRTPIINSLKKGDYIGAISQCQSSAGNLNLAEGSQTVAPFLGNLFAKDCKKVILLPDGTSVTPTEAYEWLKNQNKTQEVVKNVKAD